MLFRTEFNSSGKGQYSGYGNNFTNNYKGPFSMVSQGGPPDSLYTVPSTTIYVLMIRFHVIAQLVQGPRYKLEGCGFASPCCHWNLSLT